MKILTDEEPGVKYEFNTWSIYLFLCGMKKDEKLQEPYIFLDISSSHTRISFAAVEAADGEVRPGLINCPFHNNDRVAIYAPTTYYRYSGFCPAI